MSNGKGDKDTRTNKKVYHENIAKVKKVRETVKAGFVMKVNGKVVNQS